MYAIIRRTTTRAATIINNGGVETTPAFSFVYLIRMPHCCGSVSPGVVHKTRARETASQRKAAASRGRSFVTREESPFITVIHRPCMYTAAILVPACADRVSLFDKLNRQGFKQSQGQPGLRTFRPGQTVCRHIYIIRTYIVYSRVVLGRV